jgi:hypothetical protein
MAQIFCSSARVVLTLLAIIVASTCPTPAAADIAGAGPDESVFQAYGPLEPGTAYSGAFTNPNDLDYLAFTVASAGETLEFAVQNTTQVCNDPNGAGCPVYATLMDSSGVNQVGGDNSDAGTIATYGDAEAFVWTFAQPGTYFMLMESDGDLPAGSPSYEVSLIAPPVSGGTGSSGGNPSAGGGSQGGSTGTSGPAPPPRLTVSSRQRGRAVRARIVLKAPAASLQARLLTAGPRERTRTVTHLMLRYLRAGSYELVLRLPASYRRGLTLTGHLSLLVKVTIVPSAGSAITFTRRVTLRR